MLRSESPSGTPPRTRLRSSSCRSLRRPACSTIAHDAASRSAWPCGSSAEVRDLAPSEQVRRRVLAGRHARAAADAGRRVHRLLGDVLRDRDGVAVRRAADVDRDVAAGRDDAVERAAIDDEVLDDRERLGAPRLDRDRVAVLEAAHVQLADGRARGRARAATPLTTKPHVPQMPSRQSESNAIGSSPLRISPSLTTSSISRNDMSGETSLGRVVHQPARRGRAGLPPDFQSCSLHRHSLSQCQAPSEA